MRQGRDGEELQGIAVGAQIAAIYTSDWFWDLCVRVFPNNDVLPEERDGGAPQHFPDWFLFLAMCAAGIAGHATIKSAVKHFRDRSTWVDFVARVDAYVPDGMTRLRNLPCRKPDKAHPTLTRPGTKRNSRTRPRTRSTGVVVPLRVRPTCEPPQRHHLDQFELRWRGIQKKNRQPFPLGHRDYGLRDKAFAAFRDLAVDQAQAMGVMNPGAKFFYRNPDRNQFVGADGTVMPVPRKTDNATAALCRTGTGKKVFGSKYTIFSTRINSQYMSRIILDLVHTHTKHPGSARTESDAVLDVMPKLRALSNDGVKGLLVDSAVRGQAVIELQRGGLIVVNYPHAQHNPGGGPGRRLNPSRKEKSRLRFIPTHTDATGQPCEHFIYAVGGELLELVGTDDGTDAVRPLRVSDYERRGEDGKVRERLTVEIKCAWAGDFSQEVPLFHADATSTSPSGTNWGEVCRVYPPGSAEFKYLYGARNDTEARHSDLKARVKNLSRDVLGQELRLLAASVARNAIAWQVHLQAHGENNVLDDTA